jgi:phage host-nuclease inhibitor protein Gam
LSAEKSKAKARELMDWQNITKDQFALIGDLNSQISTLTAEVKSQAKLREAVIEHYAQELANLKEKIECSAERVDEREVEQLAVSVLVLNIVAS